MKKILQILLFFPLALCSSSLLAQQQPLDLGQCIEIAIKNNIQLKINRLTVQNNANNLEQSRMARMPNLNAGAGQGWNFGRNIDPFTNQFTTDPVNSNNFSIVTNIPIFNGFQISNTIKQNEVVWQGSQLDLQKAQNDLVLNVLNAYLNIIFNRELLQTTQVQLQNTQEQLARSLTLIEAGALPEANKYEIIAQEATDKLNVTNAQNNLHLAKLRLLQLLQLPAEQDFEVVIPEIQVPQTSILPQQKEIYAVAEVTQPDVKSADLGIRSAELGIEIAKSNFYPTLTLGANMLTGYSSQGILRDFKGTSTQVIGFLTDQPNSTVSVINPEYSLRKNPFGNQLEQNFRQNVQISLNIPIFNRYQARTAVLNAQLQEQRSRLNAQNVRNVLRQTIEQAYADAVAAQSSYQANSVRVDALNKNLTLIEQRLALGAANATDYALAKNNLAIANSDWLRAKYNYVFRAKVLDFYLGKELSW